MDIHPPEAGAKAGVSNQSVRFIVLGAVIAAAGVAIAIFFGFGGGSPGIRTPSKPRAAPEFTVKDAKGAVVKLTDFGGKAALVHFWASWCPPCLEETPNFVKLASDLNGKNVAFIAVSIDESWADAQKILNPAAIPADLVSLLDLTKQLPETYGTYQYPETYLLNREHFILTKWVGPQDWANPRLRDFIERAASGTI